MILPHTFLLDTVAGPRSSPLPGYQQECHIHDSAHNAPSATTTRHRRYHGPDTNSTCRRAWALPWLLVGLVRPRLVVRWRGPHPLLLVSTSLLLWQPCSPLGLAGAKGVDHVLAGLPFFDTDPPNADAATHPNIRRGGRTKQVSTPTLVPASRRCISRCAQGHGFSGGRVLSCGRARDRWRCQVAQAGRAILHGACAPPCSGRRCLPRAADTVAGASAHTVAIPPPAR